MGTGPGAHFWNPMGHFLAQLCQLGVSSWIYAGFIHQMRTERINPGAWISRPWFQSHGGISRNTNLQLGKGLEIGPKVFYSSVGPLRSLKNPAGRPRSWAVGVDPHHRTTEVGAAPIACDEPSGPNTTRQVARRFTVKMPESKSPDARGDGQNERVSTLKESQMEFTH